MSTWPWRNNPALRPAQPGTVQLLAVEELSLSFGSSRHWTQVTNKVSFGLGPGDTVGLIGESGSGKTVTGLALMGLLPRGQSRVAGRILFEGANIATMPESKLRTLRGRRIAMIFQEPMTALDPVFTIGEQLVETLRSHFPLSRRVAREQSIEALAQVGIASPAARMDDYPHHLSGGMRQRVMIAVALACEPALLIADEPTTALDVTVQAQVVELLLRLVSKKGTALLFISHDLGVVAQSCDRVLTMYAGEVVEDGAVNAVLERPLHPYTSGLLRALPRFAAHRDLLPSIPGHVPSPDAMPPGCRFEPRCAYADTACKAPQLLLDTMGGRAARCHRQDELHLPGVLG